MTAFTFSLLKLSTSPTFALRNICNVLLFADFVAQGNKPVESAPDLSLKLMRKKYFYMVFFFDSFLLSSSECKAFVLTTGCRFKTECIKGVFFIPLSDSNVVLGILSISRTV